MKTKMFEIKCFNCHETWMVQGESLINGDIEKNYKEKIKDNSFFNRKCSKCGNIISFTYPFIYQDPKRKVMITLNISAPESDYKIINVNSGEELSEAVRIVDDGLEYDDIIKLKGCLYNYGKLSYLDDNPDYLFFDSSRGVIGVEKSSVDEYIK